jgi:hypothetical protein
MLFIRLPKPGRKTLAALLGQFEILAAIGRPVKGVRSRCERPF